MRSILLRTVQAPCRASCATRPSRTLSRLVNMAKRKREVEEEEAPRRKKKASGGSGVSTVVTLDFSKDTSEGRKKFKEGDYPFKVKTIKMGKSEQKGTPFCQVNLVHAKGS